MLSANRIRGACPQCRAQLLSLYEHGFTGLVASSQRVSRGYSTHLRHGAILARRQAGLVRALSSNPIGRQGVPDPSTSTSVAGTDPETLVREAKKTFGDTLPLGYLSEEEYKIYERLYGPPLRETRPEDVGLPFQGDATGHIETESIHMLLRETEEGDLEEVEYSLDVKTTPGAGQELAEEEEEGEELDIDIVSSQPRIDGQVNYIHAVANNKREYDALVKLQQDFEAATLQPAEEDKGIEEEQQEEEEEEQEEEEEEEEPAATFTGHDPTAGRRLHPFTIDGQFKTNPSTLYLPKTDFVEPITMLLARTDKTHIQEAAEKIMGGTGLPFSPATPESKKNLPQKPIALEAGHHRMSEIDADVYISTILPGVYATVMSALVETRKRLGPDWMKDLLKGGEGQGPRVLDAGAGGAGLAAWQEVLQVEWDLLRENGEVQGKDLPIEPPGKKTAVVGSDNLRHRISRFLHNTTFLPRLPDYVHSTEGTERLLDAAAVPQQRKTYDVILATHMLMPLDKPFKRKALLDNLWTMLNPDGGVLIVMEKGHPRGFEAVADVRARLLDEFIIPPGGRTPEGEEAITVQAEGAPESARAREEGMIVAPCTNHTTCPMYLSPGISPGRKDFCHFSQRFIRPPFLQRVIGASHKNHEDIKFSYVAVRRGNGSSVNGVPQQGREAADRAFAGYGGGDEASDEVTAAQSEWPDPLTLPRNILPPLKRHGHVTLDLCTPAGAIERWTVPRSFGKQAYHDARKAQWGDLWALGAKSRTVRAVRVGRGLGAGDMRSGGGVRARVAAETRGVPSDAAGGERHDQRRRRGGRGTAGTFSSGEANRQGGSGRQGAESASRAEERRVKC